MRLCFIKDYHGLSTASACVVSSLLCISAASFTCSSGTPTDGSEIWAVTLLGVDDCVFSFAFFVFGEVINDPLWASALWLLGHSRLSFSLPSFVSVGGCVSLLLWYPLVHLSQLNIRELNLVHCLSRSASSHSVAKKFVNVHREKREIC